MVMRTNLIWLPCEEYKPNIIGTYLVVTNKGAIRIDRWDGEMFGLCRPRHQIKNRDKGKYKPHRAWAYMPQIPNFESEVEQ